MSFCHPGHGRNAGQQRGIATVEYLVILTCTILVAAVAAKATGPHLVMMLLDMTMWLSLPVP